MILPGFPSVMSAPYQGLAIVAASNSGGNTIGWLRPGSGASTYFRSDSLGQGSASGALFDNAFFTGLVTISNTVVLCLAGDFSSFALPLTIEGVGQRSKSSSPYDAEQDTTLVTYDFSSLGLTAFSVGSIYRATL